MSQQIRPDLETREAEAPPIELGGPWVVILYNCDCHDYDDVTAQLCLATGCSAAEAQRIADEAEQRGRAIAFTGDDEECGRVAGVLRAIRLQVETDIF